MEHTHECPAKEHTYHTCAEVRVAWEDWKTKYDSAFSSYKGQLEKVRLLELQLREAENEMDRLRTLSEGDPALVHALTKERDAANRLNGALREALLKMLKEYPASTFCDVDCSTVYPCEHCALEMEVSLLVEKR